ncbi:hypothetical protein JL722_9319 [Aureococcus anophagefferens]|nr:hypothetical protein JL722_9319 [Aureococcus anophagefferens]
MEPGQPDPGVPPPVDVPDAGSPVAEEAYTPVAVAEAELHKKGEEAHYAALELADAAVAADYGAAAGGEPPPDYPDNPDYAPEAYGGGAPPPGAVPPAGYAPPGGEQWTPRSYAMAAAHAEMQQAAIEHHMMESMMAEAMMREHIHAEMERGGDGPGRRPHAAPPALVDFDAVAAPPAPVNGAAADAAADVAAAAPVDDEPVVLDDEPVVADDEPVILDDEPVVLDDEPVVLADAAAPPAVALDASPASEPDRGLCAAAADHSPPASVAPADSDLQSTAKTLASPASDASEPAAARFDEPAEPAALTSRRGGGGARGGGDGPRALRRAAGGGCGDAPRRPAADEETPGAIDDEDLPAPTAALATTAPRPWP